MFQRNHLARQLFLLTVLVLLLFSTCARSTSPLVNSTAPPDGLASTWAPPPPGGGEDIITITFACHEWLRAEFEELAKAFHASYPGINVRILALEDVADLASLKSPQEANHQIVSAADTVHWVVDPGMTRQGLVRDLSPFINADSGFDLADFDPEMFEFFRWDDAVWALPTQAHLRLIFYDKDAFDAAGLSYPRPGWTQEDFLTTAQQLTLREGDTVVRYGFVSTDWSDGVVFTVGQVGSLVDASGEPGVPNLNTPNVAKAIRWYTDLALKHSVMPDPASLPSGDGYFEALQDLVSGGRAAMWTDSLTNYGSRSQTSNLGLAPFPLGERTANRLSMYGYLMSSGTTHPQESWRWLSFLTHQRIIGPYGIFSDSIPARRSVAEQSYYWARWDEETTAVLQYALEHALTTPWDATMTAVGEAIRDVFAGKVVEEALMEAQVAALQVYTTFQEAAPRVVVVATPRPEETETGQVTVTFFSPNAAAYHSLVATFNKESPDTQVQLVLSNEANSADCFAGSRSVTDESTRAELLNLQPLLEADLAFSTDDFYPRFLDAFRYQGAWWGVPIQAQVKVVFYNKDLFDQAGISYPEPGWTLDDFLSHAIALTQGEGNEKQYGFLPLNGDASDLLLFITLHGGVLWDEHSVSPRPRFDEPDVVAAVRWYADLALKHGVMPAFPQDLPDPNPQAWETRRLLIQEGRVAMWTDFTSLYRFDVLKNIRYGIAPMPQGTRQATQFIYEGLYISVGAANPQACWEWLKFVSGQISPLYSLPARRSTARSVEFERQVGVDVARASLASLEYIDTFTELKVEDRDFRPLFVAFASILDGTSPEAALAEAQRKATE